MIAMIISTAYLFFSQPDRKQLNNIMKIAVISALFFALFVLTFFIFEDLFWNSYYHILSEASRAYADRYIPRGFSPVLGGSCTYTDYVMMVGVGVFCGIFFSLKKESKRKKDYMHSSNNHSYFCIYCCRATWRTSRSDRCYSNFLDFNW